MILQIVLVCKVQQGTYNFVTFFMLYIAKCLLDIIFSFHSVFMLWNCLQKTIEWLIVVAQFAEFPPHCQ